MEIALTTTTLDNFKKVLYGNQKQANVINESVALYLAKYLSEHGVDFGGDVSEEELVKRISDTMQKCVNHEVQLPDDLVMLLCGEVSLRFLKSGGPCVLKVDQPNIESPKHTFRIWKLGEVPEAVHTATVGVPAPTPAPVASAEADKPIEEGSLMKRAIEEKDKILVHVPSSAKLEIPDNEWALALCYAEYYYNM